VSVNLQAENSMSVNPQVDLPRGQHIGLTLPIDFRSIVVKPHVQISVSVNPNYDLLLTLKPGPNRKSNSKSNPDLNPNAAMSDCYIQANSFNGVGGNPNGKGQSFRDRKTQSRPNV